MIGTEQHFAAAALPEFHIAIVGGGPGGLLTAWYLAEKLGPACRITIFEASERLGGKIVTGEIPGVGLYEAGLAEIYDYSAIGPDPLRDLIERDLGLETMPIKPGGCILDGRILRHIGALADHFGTATYEAAAAFKQRCTRLLKPAEYYRSVRSADNGHPWAQISGEDVLATEIPDDVARRYTRVMCHSDVAAAPHQTTGLNLLKNVLMDVDGYIDLYSVIGGNEQIVHRLREQLDAEVRLNAPVGAVQLVAGNRVRLTVGTGGAVEAFDADFVVLALPLTALSIIAWRNAELQQAMARHIGYFDRPGHYLRATLLFERPFWRQHLDGAWWMLDAFDGCCVYDEGARHELGSWGALGFLIAGNAALSLANLSDERIEEMCLDALPAEFSPARTLLVDRRVHRWMASVNAVPGGVLVRDRLVNHQPAKMFPQILAVGDYMFDATLNGVLDSAEAASDVIVADVLMRRRAASHGPAARVTLARPQLPDRLCGGACLAQLLDLVWGLKPGAKVLHVGAAAAITAAALRDFGFDTYALSSDQFAEAPIPESREFNLLDEPFMLPFPDGHFDAAIETMLCYLPQSGSSRAITELRRVTRCGVMLGSIVSDLPLEMIERHNLLASVKSPDVAMGLVGGIFCARF